MRIPFALLTAVVLLGCTSGPDGLPPASGLTGDMFLVMDSAQWRGPLGRTLDSIFSVDMPGLPRKESIYKMRWINPRKLNYILKQRRNLIFVTTLDRHAEGSRIVQGLFTKASIEKIKTSPADYITTTANVFANGQDVMYLYGVDEPTLLRNVRANASRLVDYFDVKERVRITHTLFRAGQVKSLSQVLTKEYQCDLKIPFGFKLADKQADFVWLRQINPREDKDVFIARKHYTSQDDFKKENLIAFRDDICRKYLFEDPDQSDSYLLTETTVPFIPVTADPINFNGSFAVKLRGIWRTHTLGMGGPFEGIALVDQGTQQFYYVEGFTFSPGKDQREIMRELEVIIYTFKTSQDLKK